MPHGEHKGTYLGWFAPAGLAEWFAGEVKRRGGTRGTKSALLTEALADLRAKRAAEHPGPPAPVVAARDEQPQDCPHPKARINKGLCGACGTHVGTSGAR